MPETGKIAYLMSRFPKLTETFILGEMLAMEQLGQPIAVYALQRHRDAVVHPEAAALLPRVQFHRGLSWALLAAHAHYLRRAPRAYGAALWTLLRANFGSWRYFVGGLVFFPKIVYFARQMERQGVVRVHAHFASHPAAAAFVIRRLTGIPYSFTAHGSDLHRDRHMLRQKVSEAELVVTVSEHNKECIVGECGPGCRPKVVVVHCGVDTRLFHPPQRPPPLHEIASILCIGTLHEVKGQRHLLQACQCLRDRGIRFTCELIGEGPDRHELAGLVDRAGLGQHVRFRGELSRQQMAAILPCADVLAAPSVPSRDGRREGIPVVLMEAMASGVAVVASRLSGIPELVEHDVSGLLIPPGDHVALADALERLILAPPLRARLAAAGRARVERQFDLHANARRLAACFTAEASR